MMQTPVRTAVHRAVPALVLTLAVTALTAACGGGSSAPATGDSASGGATIPAGDIIKIDGSSTVFPITEAVAEEFQKANKGTKVTVGISGTGGGFKKFCTDETDISDASRPILPAEKEACQKAGVQYVELPIAYDGLAIIVNPKNTWATSITVAELKKLWEPGAQGKITRWSQVRDGWPDKEIHLFGPGVDSGTFDYFTEAVNGKAKDSRGDYTSSEDDNVLVQGISGDEFALGYFGFAYFEENQGKLKLVPVDDEKDANGKGPILPSPETVMNGTYAPLSRPIFIYAKVKALDRPEVKGLVDFYLSKGPELVREVGYIQLADKEYELVRSRFAGRKTGSMYTDAHDEQSGTSLEQRLSQ